METLTEIIEKKTMDICNDRYLCEVAGMDYCNIDYNKVLNYVLNEYIKNG
jgi:hypothetical protein